MGISYSKSKPYRIDSDQLTGNLEDCPTQFCDYNQIGKVYLIQHKVNSATAAKSAHFSVYIDTAGESVLDERLAGIHAHLVVYKLSTINTDLLYNYESHNWNDFDDVHFVGQLNLDHIFIYRAPALYALNLQHCLHQWYRDLAILNGSINWSSLLNCQKYAYNTIVGSGFDWPDKYSVAGDITPYVIDIYMKGKQTMAVTTEKLK